MVGYNLESIKGYLGRHKVAVTSMALLAGVVGTCNTIKSYLTFVEAKVLEERMVPTGDNDKEKNGDKDKSYVLHLKVFEKESADYNKSVERLCTFYIKEDKDRNMPISVLEEAIIPGSKIFIPYFEKGVFPIIGEPESQYKVGCLGTIDSVAIRVISPGENSEVVRKQFEKEYDTYLFRVQQRARFESKSYMAGSKI